MKNIYLSMILVVAGAGNAYAQTNTPPCSFDLSTEQGFSTWTVVDGNPSTAGSVFWEFDVSENAATCGSNKAAADDWLISPAVNLKAGKAYTIGIEAKSSGSWDYQDFDITLGTAQTSEAQTTIIKSIKSYKSTFYSEQTGEFVAPSDGVFHFAIHYKSSKYNGNLYIKSVSVASAPEYPAHVADLQATAGAEGAMEATLSWTWPTTTDKGAPLTTLTGARIERKDDSSYKYSYEEIARIETGVVIGGQATYVDKSIPKAGTYRYRITAYNAEGNAQGTAPNVAVAWIGEDTPKAVTNLSATGDGNNVIVNFTPPTAGENGYYLDVSNLTYKIVRSTNEKSITLEAAYKGTLPYTDASITELGSYTYTVTPVSKNGSVGKSATSNSVTAGPSLMVPYTADLTVGSVASLFSFADANKDNRTWKYSSGKGISYWGGETANDWAFSPRLQLTSGKAYKVTIKANLSAYGSIKEEDYKRLAIAFGNNASAEAMGAPAAEFSVTSQYSAEFETNISANESGDYHIGIQVFGPSSSNDVVVSYFAVEEQATAPLQADNVTATAGLNGAMEATVQWTNPTKDNTGNTLTSLTKVEIYRDGTTLAGTSDNTTPGAVASFTDKAVSEAGIHSYSVRCYLGENFSETTATTGWVGFDTPLAVSELTANANGTKVEILFVPPKATVNGGYLETEGMGYKIMRGETVLEQNFTGALPYTDNVEALDIYTYSVTAVTKSGLESAPASSAEVKAGSCMEIPYEANLTSEKGFLLMDTYDGNRDGRCWTYSSYDDAAQIYSKPSTEGDWLFTPPLSVNNHYRHKVTVGAALNRAWSETSYTTVNVYYGPDATPEGQQLLGTFVVESTFTDEQYFEFEPSTTGIYRIGLQAMGNDDMQTLYVKTLRVETAGISGISTMNTDRILYDRLNDRIICPNEGMLTIVDTAGRILVQAKDADGIVSTSLLEEGIYIATFAGDNGIIKQMKFIK